MRGRGLTHGSFREGRVRESRKPSTFLVPTSGRAITGSIRSLDGRLRELGWQRTGSTLYRDAGIRESSADRSDAVLRKRTFDMHYGRGRRPLTLYRRRNGRDRIALQSDYTSYCGVIHFSRCGDLLADLPFPPRTLVFGDIESRAKNTPPRTPAWPLLPTRLRHEGFYRIGHFLPPDGRSYAGWRLGWLRESLRELVGP